MTWIIPYTTYGRDLPTGSLRIGTDCWAPTCVFSLDSLGGAQDQVLRELKGAFSSPHSLATAMLVLRRFPEGLLVKKGVASSLGLGLGVGNGGSQSNCYY